MPQFWITLYGKDGAGKTMDERIASPFPTINAAMDKAETLMENHEFPWGWATSFVVKDEDDNTVLRGAIHA